ncbi:hypothetical protein DMH01_31985 [Amycolatopsis sp. WAC 04182]|nr:hypothetical protein DMH01_31985 [Amycolatopsis sp. WAC 04182]
MRESGPGRCESHFRNVQGCESGFRNARSPTARVSLVHRWPFRVIGRTTHVIAGTTHVSRRTTHGRAASRACRPSSHTCRPPDHTCRPNPLRETAGSVQVLVSGKDG